VCIVIGGGLIKSHKHFGLHEQPQNWIWRRKRRSPRRRRIKPWPCGSRLCARSGSAGVQTWTHRPAPLDGTGRRAVVALRVRAEPTSARTQGLRPPGERPVVVGGKLRGTARQDRGKPDMLEVGSGGGNETASRAHRPPTPGC
jgi:hypothetical protein